MSIDYTTTSLIRSIRRRVLMPNVAALYKQQDIVEMSSEELDSDIVPLIMAVRNEYMVKFFDFTVEADKDSYRLPSRAIGGKLRDFVIIDDNGRETNFPYLSPDLLKHNYTTVAVPYFTGWFFKDDLVTIYPDARNWIGRRFRMKFFRKPNDLVLSENAGKIISIDTGLNQVVLNNSDPEWDTSTLFDFTEGIPIFTSKGDDFPITDINGTILTFDSLPSDLSVGDWVSEARTSPIPQIPYEVHKLLAQRVAVKILEGTRDTGAINSAVEVYKDMVSKFRNLVSPRADGSPKKVVSSSGIFQWVRSNSLYYNY